MPAGKLLSMMSIATVAEMLDCSPWTIRTWIRNGLLSSTKVGRRVLIRASEVEALVAKNYKSATRV